MRPQRSSALPALWLLAALGAPPSLAGCGYSTDFALPENTQSVGIEVFKNESRWVELERPMHLELTRSTRNLVDASIVDPRHADLVVRGTIDTYSRRMGVRSSENVLLESGLTLGATVELWDRARGELLAGPLPVSVQIGYTLDELGNEAGARERAIRNLADRIVIDLFGRAAVAVRAEKEAQEPR